MNPWTVLEENPPWTVRLMARRKIRTKTVVALSDAEVAIAANMTIDRVRGISHLSSWDGVPVGEVRAFCRACNFDPFSPKDLNRRNSYLRSAKFTYLRKSPWWDCTFKPLIERFKAITS